MPRHRGMCAASLCVLFVLTLTSRASAANDIWDNNPGGNWENGANWTDGSTPGTTDFATFNLAATYSVTFGVAPTAIQNLIVSAGTVTFVSGNVPPTKTLSVTAALGGNDLALSGATTTLNLGSTAVPSNALNLTLGDDLSVQSGATLQARFGSDVVAQGLSSGLNGTIRIDGSGSTLTLNRVAQHLIANTAAGSLLFQNGASGDLAGGLRIADNATGVTGTVSLTGGSTLDIGGSLALATQNVAGQNATLTINGTGSELDQSGATTITVGSATNGTAAINIGTTATGGTLTTATGLFTINNTGTVNIGTGANTGTLNANGNVTINGGTLSRTSGSAFNLADGKTMTIRNGGAASFAGQYITATDAIYDVTDSGSVLGTSADTFRIDNGAEVHVDNGGSLVANTLRIANSGDGTLTVDGLGSSVTSNISNIWGQSGNTANVTFSNGAIGTFAATLELGLSGAGTTATVNILSGAELNANGALGLVSASGGATATLNVQGVGSSVNAAGFISVGHVSDGTAQINIGTTASGATFTTGTNTLTINRTGTITIGGGANTGTLNVNGNIAIEGGALEKANSASTFNWAAGKTMEIQNGGRFSIDGAYTTATNAVYNIRLGSTLETTGSFSPITLDNGAEINVSTGGLLSSSESLQIGHAGDGTLTADGPGSMVVAAAGFNNWALNGHTATVVLSNHASAEFAGSLNLAGDSVPGTTADVTVQSGADLSAGGLFLATFFADPTASATLTVDGHGSTVTLSPSAGATIGLASGGGAAIINVQNGGSFTVGTDGTFVGTAGTINIDGGVADLKTLGVAGTLNFMSGALSYLGDLTVGTGGLLGENLTLASNRHLTLNGTTTVETGRALVLDGGTLNTGALVVNGMLTFNAGTLGVTGAGGLTLGAGGPLGGTLTLGAGRTLNVTNTTTVNSGSLLVLQNGGGFISGNVTNSGEIVLDGTSALLQSAVVNNAGLLRGRGRVDALLNNQAAGEVRIATGELLQFIQPASSLNSGRINLLGGTMEFTQSLLTNAASGQIVGQGSLIAAGGIHNDGTIAFSGPANVLGDVTNDDGLIISSGGGPTTFFDDVTNENEIRTSPGSFSVFFGGVSGGGTFTGSGTVNIEGDLSPGASPAIVSFGGNLHFGGQASVEIEIGGLIAGSQFDRLDVAGTAVLAGTLDVSLINDFAPTAGDTFEILTAAGGVTGTFTDELLPTLAGNLSWDITYGSNSVVLEVAAPGLLGDYNQNGVVDAADYTVWQDTLGSTTNLAADGDASGTIDAVDYDVWKTNFGAQAASSAIPSNAAVPEPQSWILLSLAAILWGAQTAPRRR